MAVFFTANSISFIQIQPWNLKQPSTWQKLSEELKKDDDVKTSQQKIKLHGKGKEMSKATQFSCISLVKC